MKNLCLVPSHDHPRTTTYLQLEWSFFSLASSKNVSESALFILPVVAQDKIFIRYFEVGVYRGFTKKFLPVILQKYDMPQESAFLWQLYTDRDTEEENSLEKYPYHSTRGSQRMMYSNDKSVGNFLAKVQATLDQMHCLMYTEKKNSRPNEPLDNHI